MTQGKRRSHARASRRVDAIRRLFAACVAVFAILCVAAPMVARAATVGDGVAGAGARLAATDYHWAYYAIADDKIPTDYSGSKPPLVLVFSTNELGDTYNSGSALYGNGLKRVIGSGDTVSDKELGPWTSGILWKSASNVPWQQDTSGVDHRRVYAVQNANDSDVIAPVYAAHLFQGMSQLRDISDLRYWDTSRMQSLEYLFHTCTALRDVSAVGDWDVSKVTSLDNLFRECDIEELEIWDWKPATNVKLSKTFYQCEKLTTIYCHNAWTTTWTTSSSDNNPFAKCTTALHSTSSGKTWNKDATSADYCNPTTGYFTGNPKDGTEQTTRVVQLPKPINLIYNGKPQVGVQRAEGVKLGATSSGASIDAGGNAVATNAGTHSVTASLTEDNTQWMPVAGASTSTPDRAEKSLSFKIERAELFFEAPKEVLYYAQGKKFQVPIRFTTDSEGIVFSEDDIKAIKASTKTAGVEFGKYAYLGDGKTVMLEVTVNNKSLTKADLTFSVDGDAQNIWAKSTTGELRFAETNVPQPNRLTYNGTQQVGIDASEDYTLTSITPKAGTGATSEGMGIVDDAAKATHAGTYVVTATPNGTEWADETGGRDAREIEFTIAKATPEIVLEHASITRYVGDTKNTELENQQIAFRVKYQGASDSMIPQEQLDETDMPKCTVAAGDQGVMTVTAPDFKDDGYVADITPVGAGTRSATISVGTAGTTSGNFNRVTSSVTITVKKLDPYTTSREFTFDGTKKYGVQLDNASAYKDDVKLEWGEVKSSTGGAITDTKSYGREETPDACRFFGTHAGTYKVKATLTSPNACWSTGSRDDQTFTFTIKKATSKLVVSPEALELEAGSAGSASVYLSLDNAYPTTPYAKLEGGEIKVEPASMGSVEISDRVDGTDGRVSFKVTPKVSSRPTTALGATVSFEGNDDIEKAEDATISLGVKTHTLTYQLNGGKGTAPTPTQHVKGEKVELDARANWEYDGTYQGKKVIFLGWAERASSAPLTKNSEKPSLVSSVTFETSDKAVYAVWAVDSNGDGIADLSEQKVKLSYDVNGGVESSKPADVEGLVPGETVTLSTKAPTHEHVDLNGASTRVAFAGWASTKPSAIYAQGARSTVPLITTYTITNDDAKAGNATVHAVWGYDANGNGKADYLEKLITLTYTLTSGTPHSETEPPASVNVLPGLTGYELWAPNDDLATQDNRPAYTGGAGTGVFIGWSLKDNGATLFDEAPEDLIKTVDTGTKDLTVYAVWGADTNDNGVADCFEERHGVTYNINGGTEGTQPTDATKYLAGTTVTLKMKNERREAPAHPQISIDGESVDVVFAGWSITPINEVLAFGKHADTYRALTMPKDDLTVYAVWSQDANRNGTPDIDERGYRVIYDVNGGVDGSQPVDTTNYLVGTDVPLKTSSEKPAHAKQNGFKVIFAGWTETDTSEKVFTYEDHADKPDRVDRVKILENGTRVYAIWALDTNGNDTPDYEDTPIKLTFDLAGGEGDVEKPEDLMVLPGASVELPSVQGSDEKPLWTKKAEVDGSGKAAVVVGWSKTKYEGIFDANGKSGEVDVSAVLVASPYAVDSEATGDITLYAVYALDANGDGTPDYDEAAVYVEYYANNGKAASPSVKVGSDGKFYTSPERYVSGQENVKLNDAIEWGKKQIEKDHAVLIGWSASKTKDVASEPDDLITSTTMPPTGKGNAKVYAVWAVDENGNGTPDYADTKYKLSYDANGGSGALSPTEGIEGLPVTLSEEKPTHDNAVFVGWADPAHKKDVENQVFDKSASEATVKGYLVKGNQLVMPRDGTTVLAVWAADVNGNGTADFSESAVHVEYYTNGGTPVGSSTAKANAVFYTDLAKYVPGETGLTLLTVEDGAAKVHRTGCVLVGWSESMQEPIKRDGTIAEGTVVKQVTMPAEGEGNAKVYAVWAEDANGDGTADYLEDKYTVTYDINGGSGTVPTDHNHYLKGEKATLLDGSGLTHANQGEHAVIFDGWTLGTEASDKVYGYANKGSVPAKVTGAITIDGNKTLYALWAEDANGNHVADYAETKHKLIYDANGGDFAGATGLVNREEYLPSTTVDLWKPEGASSPWKREAINAVFVGWSASKDSKIYGKLDHETSKSELLSEVTIDSKDVTVYAVWAYDINGNGVADYTETPLTLTFDANGGHARNAENPSYSLQVLKGEKVSLPTVTWTKASGGDHDAVFAGWTETEAITQIIPANDLEASSGSKLSDKLIKTDSFAVPSEASGTITLYAAYAEDGNRNDRADYGEAAAHVEYYANGGEAASAYVTVGKDGKFYTCADHHVPEGSAEVNTVAWGKTQIAKPGAVLVGWSSPDPIASDLTEKPTSSQLLGTTVTIPPAKDGKPVNAKVYAVWAKDENGNGVADYDEKKYELTYDANAESGAVTGMPDPATVTYLSGVEVTLSETKPTCTNEDGTPIIFYGWAFEKGSRTIYGSDDASLVPATITAPFTMPAEKVTVYAIWAFDANHNGEPDFTETPSTLAYDLNGGEAPTSSEWRDTVTALPGTEITLWDAETAGAKPTRDEAIFLGWSATRHDPYRTSKPAAGVIITKATLDADGTRVYAVWAADENEDGTPDYEPGQHVTVTFNINGGRAGSASETRTSTFQVANVLIGRYYDFPVFSKDPSLSKNELYWVKDWTNYDPAKPALPAVFAGWSTERIDDVIPSFDLAGPESEHAGSGLSTKLINPDEGFELTGNTTFYAAYATDENEDGKPDYEEGKVHVEYWPNGGENPRDHKAYPKGEPFYTCAHNHVPGEENVALLDAAAAEPKNERTGYTLIGWSMEALPDVQTSDPEGLIPLGGLIKLSSETVGDVPQNTKVYAVWAVDENGNGTPDYAEAKTTLHYDANAGEGTVRNLPKDEEYVSGINVTLSTATPALDKAVFVGWTSDNAKNAGTIWTSDPSAELTLVKRVTMGKASPQTVYAVWGIDLNANATPDYQELLTLSFDANQSALAAAEGNRAVSGMPAPMEFTYGKDDVTLPMQVPACSKPEGASGIVFMGWSWTADTMLYSKRNHAPAEGSYLSAERVLAGEAAVKKSDITEGHDTLYAVWGYDTDGNGVADVLENQFTLTYLDAVETENTATQPANGGSKVLMRDPTKSADGNPFTSWTTPKGDEKRSVVFIGWAEGPVNLIVSKAMTADQTDELNVRLHEAGDYFDMPEEDAYLYAAWGYDEDGNGVADYNQEKAWLRYVYDYSLGESMANKPVDEVYLAGQNVPKLWNITDNNGGVAWQCETPTGHAVFIGWTLNSAFGSSVVSESADASDVAREVLANENPAPLQPITADTTLYAVWAIDADNGGAGDGTPDYTQKNAKLTYYESASGSTWSELSRSGVANPVTGLVAGKSYPMLNGAQLGLKKVYTDDAGAAHTAIFAGWSTVNPAERTFANGSEDEKSLHKLGIIPENEADSSYELSSLISGTNSNSITLRGTDEKLYAIYAVDEWGAGSETGDGVPDYLELAQRVEYYANGGVAVDANTHVDPDTGLFFTCADHHSAGQQAILMPVSEGREHIKHLEGTIVPDVDEDENETYALVPPKDDAPVDGVLIGWSEIEHPEFVASEAELANFACLDNEISNFPARGNARVYALWGADENSNGVWDALELKVTVKFDLLGGTGGEKPSDKQLYPRQSFETPTGTWKITLSGDDECVFYGWSTTKVLGAIGRDGTYTTEDGQRHQLNASDVTKAGDQFIVPDTGGSEIWLYAVYGVDLNDDDQADFFESGNPVRYHANGGAPAEGSDITLVDDVFYTCPHHHVANEPNVELLSIDKVPASQIVKDQCTLIGWSETQCSKVCKSLEDEESAGLIKGTTFIMPPSGAAEIYAVWAEDSNDDGTADYRASANQSIEYHSKEGTQPNGATLGDPFYVSTEKYLPNEKGVGLLTLNDAKGRIMREGYVFLGWTATAHDDVPETGTQVQVDSVRITTIDIPAEGNAKVWALWAVDANGNGIADYLEHTSSDPSGPGGSGTTGDPESPEGEFLTVYRLYNCKNGAHLFTRDPHEVEVLTTEYGDEWGYEGVAWMSPVTSNRPIYRLYNPWTGEHLYTGDYHEVQVLSANADDASWRYEGVCWFSDPEERVPIYRVFNPFSDGIGAHHYTTDAHEVEVITNLKPAGWNDEGIAWYAAG